MRLLKFPLLLSGLLILSCQKNDGTSQQIVDAHPVTNPFIACDCSSESGEYIRGEFNGAKMCFDKTYSATDTSFNVNYFQPGKQDQINMIRKNKAGLICGFYFNNSNVFHRSMPYITPGENRVYCEHTDFELLDIAQQWPSNCQGCPGDNADYFSENFESFHVIISDTTGGYLKGIFKGKALTRGGKVLIVNNGEFNVHIIKKAVNL